MSSYTEIDTALLDLDFTNPRIQNYLQNYPEESRSGELLAMLLGTVNFKIKCVENNYSRRIYFFAKK